MMVASNLGSSLRIARERANMTAPEVAKSIGCDAQAVYRWEWGKSHPHFTQLEKLAGLYGITVGQLVDGQPAEVSP